MFSRNGLRGLDDLPDGHQSTLHARQHRHLSSAVHRNWNSRWTNRRFTLASRSTRVRAESRRKTNPSSFSSSTWNWGLAWVGLFALAGSILLWRLPESPRWLVQEQQRNEAAFSLKRLRQSSLIDGELDKIIRQEATIGSADLLIDLPTRAKHSPASVCKKRKPIGEFSRPVSSI